MFLGAPKTHGVALFGSGTAFHGRRKEKRTANRPFLSTEVPLYFLLLMSENLKDSE
jgi:hypothetical protein